MKRIVPIALSLLTALLLFQNCGGMTALQSHSDSSSSSAAPGEIQYGGNGSGYDGKAYVHLRDGAVCGDGSLFDARLEGRSGQIYLARENCADIPAALQVAVQVETSPLSPGVVIYQGRVYHERILLIDDSAAGQDNARLMGGNGFTVDASGALNGSIGLLARYKADGTPMWMKTGDALKNSYKNFAALPSGDFAMVTTKLDSTGGVFKLSGDGQPVWAKALAKGNGYNVNFWFSSVATDDAGNLYLGGGLNDSTSASSGAFVMKLDATGAFVWVRTLLPVPGTSSGPAPHSQSSAVTFVSANAIFLKGNVKGVPFVARFNDAGGIYWAKTFAGFKSGFGAVHRPDYTTLISLNDTAGAQLVEINARGEVTGADRLTPPTGFTTVFVGNLLLSADGSTTATGYLGNSTQRAGLVITRAPNRMVRARWQVSIGTYTSIEFPKIGPDGLIWGQAHVPFAAGALLTSIMVRFDPTQAAPVCPFCTTPDVQIGAVSAPTASEQVEAYTDEFLTVAPATLPVFTDLPLDSFSF